MKHGHRYGMQAWQDTERGIVNLEKLEQEYDKYYMYIFVFLRVSTYIGTHI